MAWKISTFRPACNFCLWCGANDEANAFDRFSLREQGQFWLVIFAGYFSRFYLPFSRPSFLSFLGMLNALVKLNNWKLIAETMKMKQVGRCKKWAEYSTKQQPSRRLQGEVQKFNVASCYRDSSESRTGMRMRFSARNKGYRSRKWKMNENDGKAVIFHSRRINSGRRLKNLKSHYQYIRYLSIQIAKFRSYSSGMNGYSDFTGLGVPKKVEDFQNKAQMRISITNLYSCVKFSTY